MRLPESGLRLGRADYSRDPHRRATYCGLQLCLTLHTCVQFTVECDIRMRDEERGQPLYPLFGQGKLEQGPEGGVRHSEVIGDGKKGGLHQEMLKITHERAPDIRGMLQDAPSGLADLVAKALEKDPQMRYLDGEQMARELRALLLDTKSIDLEI